MLLGLPDVQVEAVQRDQAVMTVTVTAPWQLMGCPDCGVVTPSRGRRRRVLHDVPHGDSRVRPGWRQRVWRCPDPACARGTFNEQMPTLVAARGSMDVKQIAYEWSRMPPVRTFLTDSRRRLRRRPVGWGRARRCVIPW